MSITRTSKLVMGFLVGMLALNTVAADPVISGVVARQRWPWSRLVDIDYVLTAEQGARFDISLTAKDGDTTLTLPVDSLTGDLYLVGPGPRRIVWDPIKTVYTNNLMLTQFSVALTPTEPPLYMIVDLTKAAGTEGQVEYVYEEDLTNNLYGAWVRNPVTNRGTVVDSVIWTGVTNGTTYKTDKLVLRRVPAGSYYQGDDDGSKANNVNLTKDMYVAVFETTQKQWNHVMGTTGGTDAQPKNSISYNQIREIDNSDDPDVNWPSNNNVNAGSFIGKLRAKTGIADFDLPTEAQWEYVCKAGTTTEYNDGKTDGTQTERMEVLGWSIANSGGTVHTVGSKLPNAWGLYDMHGNVWEWCLDWFNATSSVGTDPVGPTTGSARVRKGGSRADAVNNCRSAQRGSEAPNLGYSSFGCRVVRTLP